jgi:hypothetical protein
VIDTLTSLETELERSLTEARNGIMALQGQLMPNVAEAETTMNPGNDEDQVESLDEG